ncbi:putative acid phosphatase [Monocercomonoides exilis]|uniref:putative acid phosphatase n=1 Tax=Monocercomonoides exilis TaxID=2049356 RepID=UPI00355A54F1|nr:putative acid phosphatase [Monocercomonoides exilis]|eukprot:MONOS_61.1-p1 / transcript=MONOS_61.1 / gene=MONOS_61 / organism=Monocercomonoides_exilis_PA203 / gene_product=acid phosphatase / transcript_product=acid phosphatase / location=Mono_scaffold00001:323796-325977(+) / protein_length=500 / sequence_SO=supercontig / SO=protein_coding / is_pseudo=false
MTKLVSVQVIHRHGDRSPLENFPDFKQWPLTGQLTPTGMKQLFELGTLLKQEYVDKQHFLKENYDYNDVYIRSTNRDRTLMSAESLLMGLFPNSKANGGSNISNEFQTDLPKDFNVVPISTTDVNSEYLVRGYEACPYSKERFEEFLKTKEAEELMNKYKKEIDEVSKLMNTTLDLRNYEKVLDAIYVESLYNPDHINKRLVELRNALLPFQKEAYKHFYLTDDTDWKIASAGMLLEEMFSTNPMADMQIQKQHSHEDQRQMLSFDSASPNLASSPKSGKLFREYSAHDSTLKCLLGVLGLDDSVLPYYSAVLIVELHKKDDAYSADSEPAPLSSYYWKFYYQPDETKRGTTDIWNQVKPVQCSSMDCSFTEFRDSVKSVFPSQFAFEDWLVNKCHSTEQIYLSDEKIKRMAAEEENEERKTRTWTALLCSAAGLLFLAIVGLIIVIFLVCRASSGKLYAKQRSRHVANGRINTTYEHSQEYPIAKEDMPDESSQLLAK